MFRAIAAASANLATIDIFASFLRASRADRAALGRHQSAGIIPATPRQHGCRPASLRFDMALANDAAEIVEFSVKGTGKFRAAEAGRIKSLDQELLFDLGRLHGRSQPACEL